MILKTAASIVLSLVSLCAAVEPGTFQADGPVSKKAIALTFDDGPGLFTAQVLEVLDGHKVKATFFMNGDQVDFRPDLAREVLKRGHEVGDHTWGHENFYAYEKKHGTDKTRSAVRAAIARSKAKIEETLKIQVKILRMPHGYHRPWMKEVAKEFGYALVNWTLGMDWHNMPEDKMAAYYLKSIRPGAILLFHDGGRGRGKTVRIVPLVIEKARSKGFQIVTAGELLTP
ncbi:MAG: hypothetical protein A2901_05770 [Elusimicrobia bacterium RIFCSPLOWO2_01_FULL_54_10]|nr:MAG: hypothetical protein A2901_05770 [Elusimicrobia bacterium RIFCSPLOWO2_01_FULL_54_10]